MKKTLRTLMVGGLVAAGLSLPAAPAQAMCAGYMDRSTQQHLGVWTCESCPELVYYMNGQYQVVVCTLN